MQISEPQLSPTESESQQICPKNFKNKQTNTPEDCMPAGTENHYSGRYEIEGRKWEVGFKSSSSLSPVFLPGESPWTEEPDRLQSTR